MTIISGKRLFPIERQFYCMSPLSLLRQCVPAHGLEVAFCCLPIAFLCLFGDFPHDLFLDVCAVGACGHSVDFDHVRAVLNSMYKVSISCLRFIEIILIFRGY